MRLRQDFLMLPCRGEYVEAGATMVPRGQRSGGIQDVSFIEKLARFVSSPTQIRLTDPHLRISAGLFGREPLLREFS